MKSDIFQQAFMDEVHALSTFGKEELQRGVTSLSRVELELLVRVDGMSTVRTLMSNMRHVAPEAFLSAFRRLRDTGCLRREELDPLASQIQGNLALLLGAAPTSGGSSVGFSLGIARRVEREHPVDLDRLEALVVEDDPALSRFIKSYLAFEGLQSRMATCRSEVVAELRKAPAPDLILLDVKLPDVDGFQVLAKLREHPVYRHTPVVMLTGVATRDAVAGAIAAGADGYMTKPFDAEVLLNVVRTVLGLHPQDASQAAGGLSWGKRDPLSGRPAIRGEMQLRTTHA